MPQTGRAGEVEQVEVIKIGNGARVGLIIAVITLLLQLATLIWGAATLHQRVAQIDDALRENRKSITELRIQVNRMDRTLGQVETKVENLEEHVN